MATKVEITEKYNDTIVCKGKLILIKPSKEELDSIQAEGVKGIYVWLQTDVIDGLPVNDCFKPIIISETETVEAGDTIAHNEFGIGKIISRKATGKYWICEFNGMTETVIGVFKILAMPLDFSSEQLQMIVDGKFNHEDDVFIECRNSPLPSKYPDGHRYSSALEMDADYQGYEKVIKLKYPEKHITIFPINKGEGWDDIYKRYEDTIDPMTRSANHHDHVLQWLKEHYNSPKKK